MATYKTPGVYVEEIATLPPSVAQVSTAIPAFIGYTERSTAQGGIGTVKPQVERISTFLEYKDLFGGSDEVTYMVEATGDIPSIEITGTSDFQMYYCIDHYFKNGGGPCYIISVGTYGGSIDNQALSDGLSTLEKIDEPTLILFTEAVKLTTQSEYYALCDEVLAQCNKLGDRFGIFDVIDEDTGVDDFRNGIRSEAEYLKYGAAYTPYLNTTITREYDTTGVIINSDILAAYQTDTNGINVVFAGHYVTGSEPEVTIENAGGADIGDITFTATDSLITIKVQASGGSLPADIKNAWDTWKKSNDTHGYDISISGDGSEIVTGGITDQSFDSNVTLQAIATVNTTLYNNTLTLLDAEKAVLPPSPAMAGIYAATDNNRGVWKAPANASVVSVTGPTQKINSEEQGNLNVDVQAGKSINAIREFTGKGTLVWGARTLAGNDNEWRYISVRRLFNTIEESCQKSTDFAVFEPNNAVTWLKVKSMIDGYLYGMWQQGALAGTTAEEAYFVNVGLGKTMTSQDILEGRMVVEIGIAAVRPAEFIILRFSHKLQES
ncbi:MAG: phage tail sheath family protein [Flavobacteriaceae bacterium]|nr:MAG: phage tail sheath family protein [Flavobacteriaceae bacterium]